MEKGQGMPGMVLRVGDVARSKTEREPAPNCLCLGMREKYTDRYVVVTSASET